MKPIIISTPAYASLAQSLSELTGIELGELEIKHFPDGERYMRFAVIFGTVMSILFALHIQMRMLSFLMILPVELLSMVQKE